MPSVQIVSSTTYERAARKLFRTSEREAMEGSIAANPLAAPIIPGSGGIRKMRWASSGRGKRGGVRTIYFFHGEAATIYLLTIYAKGRTRGPEARRSESVVSVGRDDQEGDKAMTDERTGLGLEVEQALEEVVAHVRGERTLPSRVIDEPSRAHILAVRKKLGLSRRRFAERFHLDPRTLQDWEQGRRTPDQAARVLLTIIDRDPEAVERALRG